MGRTVRLAATALAAAGVCIVGAGSSVAQASTKAPSCSTVPLSLVKSTLGGSPTGPVNNQGLCQYGTASIYFSQATLLDVTSTLAPNHGTVVKGIGTYAFSYKVAKFKSLGIAVYTKGYEFTITSKTAPLSKVETLAKKVVPLV
jgi:hypothetical protein